MGFRRKNPTLATDSYLVNVFLKSTRKSVRIIVEAAIIEVNNSQKNHISADALVEVRPVDGKGFGLVTTQPVKAGTKMLAEKPLLVLKRRHQDLDRVSFAEITSVFNSLDSEKQARLLELQASAAPAALSELQCEGEMGKLLHNYNSVKESSVGSSWLMKCSFLAYNFQQKINIVSNILR